MRISGLSKAVDNGAKIVFLCFNRVSKIKDRAAFSDIILFFQQNSVNITSSVHILLPGDQQTLLGFHVEVQADWLDHFVRTLTVGNKSLQNCPINSIFKFKVVCIFLSIENTLTRLLTALLVIL